MHFAAHAYVGNSVIDPLNYYSRNVFGNLALVQAMGQAGVYKIEFSKLCVAYGTALEDPIVESDARVPMNPYG